MTVRAIGDVQVEREAVVVPRMLFHPLGTNACTFLLKLQSGACEPGGGNPGGASGTVTALAIGWALDLEYVLVAMSPKLAPQDYLLPPKLWLVLSPPLLSPLLQAHW